MLLNRVACVILPFASVEITTAKPQEMHVYFGVLENEKERHSNESLIVVAKSSAVIYPGS